VGNGRHWKKDIHTLVQDEGIIKGPEKLKSYITNYYKNIFGVPKEGNFHMDETQKDDIPQVSLEENTLLTAVYLEDEVRKTVFQMKHNKAPGPDGFPIDFLIYYQSGPSGFVQQPSCWTTRIVSSKYW
jgi:hypothetical protein